MRRAFLSTLTVLTIVLVVALAAGLGDASRPAPAEPRPVVAAAPTDPIADLPRVEAVVGYVQALDRQRVGEYLEAVTQAQLATFLASLPAPAPPVAVEPDLPPAPAPGATTGGGHSDAWWHGVATCEQGGRNDPYFGYFSFMDGSMGGQPWDLQVAAGNAVLARSGSESPAWAPACVAAGYAASPSG